MPLNKSKGNMYKHIDFTWNPIGGECPHHCSYCSTKNFIYPELRRKYQGKQYLVEKELKINLGKNRFIFVVAQNDLFAGEVNPIDICRILDHCKKFDNKYLFQSKNPKGFVGYSYPGDSVFCVTFETNRHYPQFMKNSPSPKERLEAIRKHGLTIDHVSMEPLLDFDLNEFVEMIKEINPTQVNIGSVTGKKEDQEYLEFLKNEPSKEKVLALIEELEKFTTVVRKSNFERLIK